MKTGVIIARFQTPYLHQGHRQLISQVEQQHTKIIVLLGVSPLTGSRKNPYDYYTREKMIKKEYPEIVVLPINDNPDDKVWSENLDTLLKNVFPAEHFQLYGSRDSFIPYYSGKFETIELPEHGDYNATELRKQYADKVFNSNDFRAGILYALYNQYDKVYPTVDIAVLRNNKTEILLGKKPISNTWRLVGGFADPEDESYEAAAARELNEECGAIETSAMTYERSRRINDWRYRNEADKIITSLFSCDYIAGMPIAQDDIAELNWFKLSELSAMIDNGLINGEHVPLLKFLMDKYIND